MPEKSVSRSLYLEDLLDFDAPNNPTEGRRVAFTDGKYEAVDCFGEIRE